MREQLIQYVNLLFAGNPDAEDVKQEILQNTLDRYDDLIAQGKSPEAAYSLAISGIGDITEILGNPKPAEPVTRPENHSKAEYRNTPAWKKALRAVAVCLYIISVIPLFVLSEMGMAILGLCGTVTIVGVATALIIIAGSGNKEPKPAEQPQNELQKAISSVVSILTVAVYLAISFWSGAWWITWLIFPIAAAVKGLIRAIIDLKEAKNHEV